MNDPSTSQAPVSCPQCLGETAPRELLLTTLCAKHLAEVKPLSANDIERAIEEGAADAKAVLDGSPGLPGYFRAPAVTSARCPTCGHGLEPVTYDCLIMRCPMCTRRDAPPPFVATLMERPDDSILCVWSKEFNGWVLPGDRMNKDDQSIEDTQTRTLKRQTSYRSPDRTLIYEGTSDRGLYFFVYRCPAAGALRRDVISIAGPDTDLLTMSWFSRAELLQVSPLASFYRNLFVHLPAEAQAPSYDAALDLAERWLAPRKPDPATAASLAALLRQYASNHAAFMAETHRLDMLVKLERIGALQRQCHQLEEALQRGPSAALRDLVRRLEEPRTQEALLALVCHLDHAAGSGTP